MSKDSKEETKKEIDTVQNNEAEQVETEERNHDLEGEEDENRFEIRPKTVTYDDDAEIYRIRLERSPVNKPSDINIIGPRPSSSVLSLQLSEIMRRTSFSFLYPGTDVDSYEFSSERTNSNLKIIPSIMHLVKGSLGSAFLCIHQAWQLCGLWSSLFFAICIGILVQYAYRMLGFSAHRVYTRIRVPKLSYSQLAAAALAIGPLRCNRKLCKRIRHAINVWIFIKIIGTMCIYDILMAKTLKHAFEYFMPNIGLGLRAYLIMILIPLIMFTMIRNLRTLVIISTIADLYIIICLTIALSQSKLRADQLNVLPVWNGFLDFFKFAAIFTFAIDGSTTILSIENHMKKPHYFYMVTDAGVIIVGLFVTGIGFLGFWAFGEDSESPFTIHMNRITALMVMQLLLVLFFSINFSMYLFIPFEIVWHYASTRYKWVKKHPRGERLVIITQVLLITAFSLICPNVMYLIYFMGIVCSSWLVFILPALIESCITWDERKHSGIGMAWHIINAFYILSGLTLFIGGFIILGYTLLTPKTKRFDFLLISMF